MKYVETQFELHKVFCKQMLKSEHTYGFVCTQIEYWVNIACTNVQLFAKMLTCEHIDNCC